MNILRESPFPPHIHGLHCFPIPEAFFLHKLRIAQKRLSYAKRIKDLDQCAVLSAALSDNRLITR